MELWNEVIKARETMLRFSEPRVVMTTDVRKQLSILFEYYVERTFVTKEYREQVLERGVRNWLIEENLQTRFSSRRVGNDEYHVQFPFVAIENERPVKVIKPLHLGYDETNKIIDNGGQWVIRVKALKKRGMLPEHVLFAVDGPTDTSPQGEARKEINADLESAGVIVTSYSDRQNVIEFAKQ